MESIVSMKGAVWAKHIKAQGPGLAYRLGNLKYWWRGAWRTWLALQVAKITGVPVITAELRAILSRADGSVVNYGVLSYREITDAGVAFLVDDWDGGVTDITTMEYHASGISSAAESSSDTALTSEATIITDRVPSTVTQPAANQWRGQGTQSFTGSGAIKEHGLLSSGTEDQGVLWDRSVFAVINVGNGDSIQWQYTCSISSGG